MTDWPRRALGALLVLACSVFDARTCLASIPTWAFEAHARGQDVQAALEEYCRACGGFPDSLERLAVRSPSAARGDCLRLAVVDPRLWRDPLPGPGGVIARYRWSYEPRNPVQGGAFAHYTMRVQRLPGQAGQVSHWLSASDTEPLRWRTDVDDVPYPQATVGSRAWWVDQVASRPGLLALTWIGFLSLGCSVLAAKRAGWPGFLPCVAVVTVLLLVQPSPRTMVSSSASSFGLTSAILVALAAAVMALLLRLIAADRRVTVRRGVVSLTVGLAAVAVAPVIPTELGWMIVLVLAASTLGPPTGLLLFLEEPLRRRPWLPTTCAIALMLLGTALSMLRRTLTQE